MCDITQTTLGRLNNAARCLLADFTGESKASFEFFMACFGYEGKHGNTRKGGLRGLAWGGEKEGSCRLPKFSKENT